MNSRTVLSLAAAFGLMSVSKAMSAQGDVYAEAATRLTYHLSALGLLLGALGLFIYAGVSAFRRR